MNHYLSESEIKKLRQIIKWYDALCYCEEQEHKLTEERKE